MPVQMVSRFRVKQPSAKQPLPIYKESQLPDLIDATAIQRAAPQIETGVEKEEEEEVCIFFVHFMPNVYPRRVNSNINFAYLSY